MSEQAEPTSEPSPPTEPAAAIPTRRISALDSEVLKIDDRILHVEEGLERASKDVYIMRSILIDQLIAVAFVELAIAAIIVVLVMEFHRQKEAPKEMSDARTVS